MEAIIHVHAKFLHKGSGEPVTGDEYTVRFYDRDFFDDDFLGEATPDANGDVRIDIDPEHAKSWDSPGEESPDLYFVLRKGEEQVYQSRILREFEITEDGEFNSVEGSKFDFGTYLV